MTSSYDTSLPSAVGAPDFENSESVDFLTCLALFVAMAALGVLCFLDLLGYPKGANSSAYSPATGDKSHGEIEKGGRGGAVESDRGCGGASLLSATRRRGWAAPCNAESGFHALHCGCWADSSPAGTTACAAPNVSLFH